MRMINRINNDLFGFEERYELFEDIDQRNKGLIICYALTTNTNIKFKGIDLNSKIDDSGEFDFTSMPKWSSQYSNKKFVSKFSTIEEFLNEYDCGDFGCWKIKAKFRNFEICIIGSKDSGEIIISYNVDKIINVGNILYETENYIYEYMSNNEDKQIVNILKNEFEMSHKRAVLSIQKLKAHKDIYEEFVNVIGDKDFSKLENAIEIHGFTAEQLSKDYPLSILGAYNYLIYLREEPQRALEDLKKGLPRK